MEGGGGKEQGGSGGNQVSHRLHLNTTGAAFPLEIQLFCSCLLSYCNGRNDLGFLAGVHGRKQGCRRMFDTR